MSFLFIPLLSRRIEHAFFISSPSAKFILDRSLEPPSFPLASRKSSFLKSSLYSIETKSTSSTTVFIEHPLIETRAASIPSAEVPLIKPMAYFFSISIFQRKMRMLLVNYHSKNAKNDFL